MTGACKDCADRYVGCQSKCERYAADMEKRRQRNAQIRAAKEQEQMVDGVLINQSMRKRKNIQSISRRRQGY